jgi:hypothetical protein
MSELDLVIIWSTISLILQIPFFIYILILVKKSIKLSIPFIDISKYAIGTIGFVIVFLLTSESIMKFEINVYDFLPGLITQFVICIGIYMGITYIIDRKTRTLFKSIYNELISKVK